ncbi:MAG: hypothetical protein N2235_01825 [Fischerella sp.]|nr:hypothetical protein [Fischerella sp.]
MVSQQNPIASSQMTKLSVAKYHRVNFEHGLFYDYPVKRWKQRSNNCQNNDIHQLAVWLQNYLDEMWNRQIEADLASGKLNHLIAKAEADIAANTVRDLDEVLHNY